VKKKKSAVLPVGERLSDGSFLSELATTRQRRNHEPGLEVRVVEYVLADPGRPQAEDTTYRLVTTILDPRAAPAAEVAACYDERWEFETALDELKNHQRGPRVVLRSKRPDGVRQEAWGLLCTHYAIRALMADAAGGHGIDPDRVSFTRALRAARRSVRSGTGTAAEALASSLSLAVAEICRELLPERRLRAAGRVVKRKMSNYGLKRQAHREWPTPALRPADAVRVLGL
jgi:hypothetical protein